MALADRRPVGFPVGHAPPAPVSPSYSPKHDSISSSSSFASESSPTSRSISPDTLAGDSLHRKNTTSTTLTSTSSRGSTPTPAQAAAGSLHKKPKPPSRAPIATGISTTIPVTGEKPKPDQAADPSLEDDVLYAIFLILYEHDPEGEGMTVKQICDVLVSRHPEMANLSTKTSNLVSAKLNAYVKRVEKGDSNLKYALSRDWADASPKRMVYVYRGILTKDFHLHVKDLPQKSSSPTDSTPESSLPADYPKQRRSTMYDLGVSRPAFLESSADKASQLFVPYSSAPVTASLNNVDAQEADNDKEMLDSDGDLEDLEVFNDPESGFEIQTAYKNGKRSKSLSFLQSKKTKILTAAAAAPRAPRAPCSHSPNAAAAAAALHAAAVKAISSIPKSSHCCEKWLDDVGAPEDISLSDLDKFFA
ncbi:Protein GDS1 [Meyerozyma sp. JA9]|nr:Protein GDS1 [Meyerozyma sp. JA9]